MATFYLMYNLFMSKTKIEKIQELRVNVINAIYSFELFDKPVNESEVFENLSLSEKEASILNKIAKKYDKYRSLVNSYIQNREWKRIAPLLRAILIFGSFELMVHDKALVINELVNITKVLSPGDDYKLINAVLNKIGDKYEQNK